MYSKRPSTGKAHTAGERRCTLEAHIRLAQKKDAPFERGVFFLNCTSLFTLSAGAGPLKSHEPRPKAGLVGHQRFLEAVCAVLMAVLVTAVKLASATSAACLAALLTLS